MNKKNTEDKQINYTYHTVAFLDILGQRERLKKLNGVLDSDPLDSKLIYDTLSKTYQNVNEFRKMFKDFFNSYANERIKYPFANNIQEKFDSFRGNTELLIQNISDSVIISSPVNILGEDSLPRIINSLSSTLLSTATIMLVMLARRCPIRGGIDLEGAIKFTDGNNEVYGPALANAYELESKHAQYPRVIVGENFLEMLSYFNDYDYQDKQIEHYVKGMVSKCEGLLIPDKDGRIIIHFLCNFMLSIFLENDQYSNFLKNIISNSNEYINDQISLHDKKDILYHRYIKFSKYFNLYIPRWKDSI
ncbi:MAG: hypothetical protein ACJAT2_003773 [Bacteriovoracaceae bacterium]|jgi:hypothetical protein